MSSSSLEVTDMGGVRRLVLVGDEEIIGWYCHDLMTMQEIADKVGCTKAAVHCRLDKMGVSYRGGKILKKCKHCGEAFEAQRKILKRGKAMYCSMRCYQSHVSVYGKFSREGQRRGRKIAEAKPTEIVHHIDGNTFNNVRGNLVVFRSNAQHMSFHKSGAAVWLKDRVARRKIVLTEVTRWPDGEKW